MVKLPRDISTAAAARRSLLADAFLAMLLALIAIVLAAGIGVVGFVAALVLLAILVWISVEAAARGLIRRLRRQPDGSRASKTDAVS
jgi:hypothetical protein